LVLETQWPDRLPRKKPGRTKDASPQRRSHGYSYRWYRILYDFLKSRFLAHLGQIAKTRQMPSETRAHDPHRL
jgi:hypothetical protein